MVELDFIAVTVRLHVMEKNKLVFRGFFPEDNPDKRKLEVHINGRKIPFEIDIEKNPDIRRRYLLYRMNVGEEITCTVKLPQEDRKSVV